MSLLGIDVGTTGCKSVAYSPEGEELAESYREYDFVVNKAGHIELDSKKVWQKIKDAIRDAAGQTRSDPVTAISVGSMGEAMVPVTKEREILDNAIPGNDPRGAEFLQSLNEKISAESVFRINGNIPNISYSFAKLAWLKKNRPEVYDAADYFLPWADFVCFMLGGSPVTNYSLASRTLLFDIHSCQWSEILIRHAGIDLSKLPPPCPPGSPIGTVSRALGKQLNLDPGTVIISGSHDQCCAALGSGVMGKSATAAYGIGTFVCMVPVFPRIPDPDRFFRNRLNIEHHAAQDVFVSLIYNISGGALVKWFRNTFTGSFSPSEGPARVSYNQLFREIPSGSNDIIMIPRFGPTGPPDFLKEHAGTISGLSLQHSRGDILLALLEGITFYFRDFLENPQRDFLNIESLVANGGGAKSEKWLQVTADVLNMPVCTNRVTEAGTLGAAILAGSGSHLFASADEGVNIMVKKDRDYFPDRTKASHYESKFDKYKELFNFLKPSR